MRRSACTMLFAGLSFNLLTLRLRRRVFAEIYQMLKKGECHYGRDPENHKEKIEQYRHFLENQQNNAILKKTA